MKMKSIVLGALAVGTVATAGVLGVQAVSAQTNSGYSILVQKIADTFHLNQGDVQKVFDNFHSQKKADMQKNFEDRLTQLVKDGKITEDQKTKILAKTTELAKQREDSKDLTPAERRAAMEKTRDDLKTWAKDNRIDEKYLLFRMHGGPGRGPFH